VDQYFWSLNGEKDSEQQFHVMNSPFFHIVFL